MIGNLERRAAMRELFPLFSSPRLVALFRAIGYLAITRPSAIGTLEVAVDRLSRSPQAAPRTPYATHVRISPWHPNRARRRG